MPKCSKCGKRFNSLQSLNDHFRAVHPNEHFVGPKNTLSRNLLVGLIIVIIVIGGLVGYLIYLQQQETSSGNGGGNTTALIGQNISSGIYSNLSGVSDSTLIAIGNNANVNPPKSVAGTPLTSNGKPVILYIGGDYCPYCAGERWSLIVALSRFGEFSGLTYMLSSASDVYANTATFSFHTASYYSQYVTFVAVEEYDRQQQIQQPLTQNETSLIRQYDSSGGIPFVDLGNQFIAGTLYAPGPLKDLNWTQIASQLNNPKSNVAQIIDSGANALISAICKIDGGKPSSVCSQSYANLSLTVSSAYGQTYIATSSLVREPVRELEKQ